MVSASPRRCAALLAVALGNCTSAGPFLQGTVWVDPCPPGPTAEACAEEILPRDCLDLIPAGAWAGGRLREPGASVSIAQDDAVTVTDGDGHFVFTNLAPGTYAVAMTVPWTVERRQVRVAEVLDTQVDEDYAMAVVAVSFTAAGILEGRVRLPGSLPTGELADLVGGIEGVDVQMACPPRSATTDAEGRFRFEGVPQGTRHLSAVGVGLVGTAEPARVLRGRTTATSIQLEYGRPPEAPQNRPPVIDGDIVVTEATNTEPGIIPVRPPTSGLARGDRVALTCHATDPDADPLQYVWSASSGSLEAGNAPQAAITAAADDIGVSCTVLDGRGGVDATHVVIDVDDSYFAGAALFDDGVILSAAYGADFDIVRWTSTGAQRFDLAGPQWLPVARGSTFGFVDRQSGLDTLRVARFTPTGALASTSLAIDVRAFAATGHGIAWIDGADAGFVSDGADVTRVIGVGLNSDLAASDTAVAVARDSESVEIYEVGAAGVFLSATIPTPGRTPGRLATDGRRVAYWSEGRPQLATASAQVVLGPEIIATSATGRIEITTTYAAYSYYESPLDFLEATLVPIDGDQPQPSQRVAVGPSEVLGLDAHRLLLGRPRAEESEPSADLWILDLSLVGAGP